MPKGRYLKITIRKMENNKLNYTYDNVIQIDEDAASRKFMANVFLWMFGALAISAFCAYEAAFNQSVFNALYLVQDGFVAGRTGLGTLVMFAPFIFILTMSFAFNKL
jgi:FtsH-binding integral membrane protein